MENQYPQNASAENPFVMAVTDAYFDTLTKRDYRNDKVKIPALKPEEVVVYCPEHILKQFKKIIPKKLLGLKYYNPYTKKDEYFPKSRNGFTARHLHLLARNERRNVFGVMQEVYYDRSVFPKQFVSTIRTLVKFTCIAGITYPRGYKISKEKAIPYDEENTPPKTILIDQMGYQWQGDIRNTGSLFFYPATEAINALKAISEDPRINGADKGYMEWTNTTYLKCFGLKRPDVNDIPPADLLDVEWQQSLINVRVQGKLDLGGLAKGLELEFLQAFEAAAKHSPFLKDDEKINFKFLKAGMGYFSEGITSHDKRVGLKLQIARLKGIRNALNRIKKELAEKPQHASALLGKIAAIELPFSADPDNKKGVNSSQELNGLLYEIKGIVESIKQPNGKPLAWLGAACDDAFVKRFYTDEKNQTKSYVNATTNCADSHTGVGNEGRLNSSVDGWTSHLTNTTHINAAANDQMKENVLDQFGNKRTYYEDTEPPENDETEKSEPLNTKPHALNGLPIGEIPVSPNTLLTTSIDLRNPDQTMYQDRDIKGNNESTLESDLPPRIHSPIVEELKMSLKPEIIKSLATELTKANLPQQSGKQRLFSIPALKREYFELILKALDCTLTQSQFIILTALMRDLCTYDVDKKTFSKTNEWKAFHQRLNLNIQDKAILNSIAFSPREFDLIFPKSTTEEKDKDKAFMDFSQFLTEKSNLDVFLLYKPSLCKKALVSSSSTEKASERTNTAASTANKVMEVLLNKLIIGVSNRRVNHLSWTRKKLDKLRERKNELLKMDFETSSVAVKNAFIASLHKVCEEQEGSFCFFKHDPKSLKQLKVFLKTNKKALSLDSTKDVITPNLR